MKPAAIGEALRVNTGTLALLLTAPLALAGCGNKTPAATTSAVIGGAQQAVPAFAYDRSLPLHFVDRGVVEHRGPVAVHDVSFLSRSERVNGFLVEQAGNARRPGIVVVHGSGGDRSELLGAAVTLARRGAVALTITEPSSAHPPPAPTSNSQLLSESRTTTQRDVIAVLRAEDVLASLPTVDSKRLGYLGWSAGAKTGAFVGASDRRVRALALLSAGADKLSAFIAAAPAGIRPQVRRVLGSVDPLRYVAQARPGTLLLEDGRQDAVVPHEALENMIEAAPPGTVVRWYPAGHALTAAAYRNAFAWLLAKLR
jgi:dienelactone hydrolase